MNTARRGVYAQVLDSTVVALCPGAQVALVALWPRQGSVAVLPVTLLSMALVGLQMGIDLLYQYEPDFDHDDRILG